MGDFFKDLVYSKNDVITFASGIPGFEKNREFILAQVPRIRPVRMARMRGRRAAQVCNRQSLAFPARL